MTDLQLENIKTILAKKTWACEFNPNCPGKFRIRFIGKNKGILDMKPIHETSDVFGYGNTLEEAAQDACTNFAIKGFLETL